jgi:hypothetical protein
MSNLLLITLLCTQYNPLHILRREAKADWGLARHGHKMTYLLVSRDDPIPNPEWRLNWYFHATPN